MIREVDLQVHDAALIHAHLGPCSINLSGPSIGDRHILATLRQAIAHGLNPSNVTYEVTETAAMTNITAAQQFAQALIDLGCEVALDDFGTGFGAFTYIKHIPAHYLKLDIEFVRGPNRSETDQALVKSIVGFAHSPRKTSNRRRRRRRRNARTPAVIRRRIRPRLPHRHPRPHSSTIAQPTISA